MTLLLKLDKITAAMLEKLKEKLSCEMQVVKKKLNEKFVERNAAHKPSANVAEFESRNYNTKTKEETASRLNQFGIVFREEIPRMVLAKCTAEQIWKRMREEPLENMLQAA